MPFTFKDSDGNLYDVDAPPGAREDVYFEKFQRALAKQGKGAQVPEGLAARVEAERQGGLEGFLSNLGAGMSNLVQGGAQLARAKGPGSLFKNVPFLPTIDYDPTDAGVRDKRTRDAALAQETTGGGLTQLLGEVLPTLAVPAGGFIKGGQAAKSGLQAVWRAYTEAAPAVAKVVPAMGRGLAAQSADAALASGATEALLPRTDDESRTLHVAGATALGSLAPGAVTLVGKLINLFRTGHAESAAAAAIIDKLGGPDEAAKAVKQVKEYSPNVFTQDIPMTPAEITQHPGLGVMEAKSARGPDAAHWSTFRGQQAEARADALHDVTMNADDLVGATERRAAKADPLRADALTTAGKDLHFTEHLVQDLARLERDPTVRGNDGAKALVKNVRDLLDSGVDPATLYEKRKFLLGKLLGPTQLGDSLSQAAKANKHTVFELRDAIDNTLNQSTGGKWQRYLDAYKGKSGEVEDATASQLLRDAAGELPTVTTSPGRRVPDLNAQRLEKMDQAASEGEFGDRFAKRTRRALDALKDNLSMTESLQRGVKKNAADSNQRSVGAFAASAAEDALIAPLSKTRRFINNVISFGSDLERATLSDALRDSDRFVKVVERKLAEGRPLTASEQWVLRVTRMADTGLATSLTNN